MFHAGHAGCLVWLRSAQCCDSSGRRSWRATVTAAITSCSGDDATHRQKVRTRRKKDAARDNHKCAGEARPRRPAPGGLGLFLTYVTRLDTLRQSLLLHRGVYEDLVLGLPEEGPKLVITIEVTQGFEHFERSSRELSYIFVTEPMIRNRIHSHPWVCGEYEHVVRVLARALVVDVCCLCARAACLLSSNIIKITCGRRRLNPRKRVLERYTARRVNATSLTKTEREREREAGRESERENQDYLHPRACMQRWNACALQ